MTAPHIVDPQTVLTEALGDASPDLMRDLLQTMINALLSADADAVVGAEWGKPSPDRVTQRNGYRHRDLDTRVGTIDVAVPKLRSAFTRCRSRKSLAWPPSSTSTSNSSVTGHLATRVRSRSSPLTR